MSDYNLCALHTTVQTFSAGWGTTSTGNLSGDVISNRQTTVNFTVETETSDWLIYAQSNIWSSQNFKSPRYGDNELRVYDPSVLPSTITLNICRYLTGASDTHYGAGLLIGRYRFVKGQSYSVYLYGSASSDVVRIGGQDYGITHYMFVKCSNNQTLNSDERYGIVERVL